MVSIPAPRIKLSKGSPVPKEDNDDDGSSLMMILGRMQAEIKYANRRLDGHVERSEADQAAVRKTLDAIMESFRNLKARVDANTRTLDKLEPLVDSYQRSQWEARGRWKMFSWARALWVAFGGALAFIATQIYEHWPRKGG